MNVKQRAGNRTMLTSYRALCAGYREHVWRCLVRHFLVLLSCIVCTAFAGCVIPTPEHSLLEGRGKIDESDLAFLEVGKTTREDILMRFGEPNVVLDEQRTLAYRWTVAHGYVFVGYGYSGAGGPIPKNYLFMLEFDEQGRLKRFKRSGSILSAAETRLDKWTPSSSEKLRRQVIMIDPMPASPAQPGTLGISARPVTFRVGEFRHREADQNSRTLVGHKKAAFGAIVADVRTCRSTIDMVRAAVTAQLEAAGHNLVDRDADITVTGEVAEFGVTTSVNIATWDAIGSLDVILEVQPAVETDAKVVRRYQAKHVSGTPLGPSKKHFEQVMRACLEDMQKQMASDVELARLLGRTTQEVQ